VLRFLLQAPSMHPADPGPIPACGLFLL